MNIICVGYFQKVLFLHYNRQWWSFNSCIHKKNWIGIEERLDWRHI